MGLHLKYRRSFGVPYQDFSRISSVFDKRRKRGENGEKGNAFNGSFKGIEASTVA
jgi:hypothetical protein